MKQSQKTGTESYRLPEPLDFKITIGKEELDAQLVAVKFVNDFASIHKIKFSDGHEGKYNFQGGHVYTDSGERDKYCLALEKEAYKPFYAWVPIRKIIIIRFPIDGIETNIWILKDEYNNHLVPALYGVYFQSEFHFQIDYLNGNWQASDGMGKKVDVDENLLNKIAEALSYYLNI